ncbi:MAG: Uma2 family endonuclease [Selenomonadaceae bacterium]|nr:Uma2 family endonuclease [Selenomonadaceae bacterium]
MNNVAYAKTSDREDYEIINGQVYMMSRPSTNHMKIGGNIFNAFKNYLKGKRCETFYETSVFFDDDNNFIPDVIIVCNPEIIEEDGIYGAPDLVVEILSPSTARNDKISKKAIYEKFGVKEYWIVDPFGKSVEVYLLKDEKLELVNVYSTYRNFEWKNLTEEQKAAVEKAIKLSIYDDFCVTLEDIFENVK